MAAFFAGFGAGLLLGGGVGFLLYALFVAGADRPAEGAPETLGAWMQRAGPMDWNAEWERLERE